MKRFVTALLLLLVLVPVHAEKVAPGSPQEAQARKLLGALGGVERSCPASLLEAESTFFCATTREGAHAFRTALAVTTAQLKPTSPWASFTDQGDQQRSYLYKDGFMTVTYFPEAGSAREHLVIVQYAMPQD